MRWEDESYDKRNRMAGANARKMKVMVSKTGRRSGEKHSRTWNRLVLQIVKQFEELKATARHLTISMTLHKRVRVCCLRAQGYSEKMKLKAHQRVINAAWKIVKKNIISS